MKKKIIITIIIIIILAIALFIINFIRNFNILNTIAKQNEETENSMNHYYFEHNTEAEPYSYREKIYKYNDIYRIEDYLNDKLYKIIWFDTSSGESISVDDNNNFNRNINYSSFQREYKEILLIKQEDRKEIFQNILISNLFRPIQMEETNYIIQKDNDRIYVNKNTGLIEKRESDRGVQTYKIEKDVTSETDVENPMKNVNI